jgi:hypothetical protein
VKHSWLIVSLLFIPNIIYCQSKTFNIVAFGAKGDGRTLNTTFIQKASDKAAAAGGGKAAGRFVTGTIHLKTGVNLWLHTFEELKLPVEESRAILSVDGSK